jgi:hypothetical protein
MPPLKNYNLARQKLVFFELYFSGEFFGSLLYINDHSGKK